MNDSLPAFRVDPEMLKQMSKADLLDQIGNLRHMLTLATARADRAEALAKNLSAFADEAATLGRECRQLRALVEARRTDADGRADRLIAVLEKVACPS